MKITAIFTLLVSITLFAACSNKDKGTVSTFAGTWIDEEYADYRSNPTDAFLCSFVENDSYTNFKNELIFDIITIDASGNTRDLDTSGLTSEVIWTVSNDGSVRNDLIAQYDDNVRSHRMEKISADSIFNIYVIQGANDTFEGRSRLIRISSEELRRIDTIVKSCP